jgi:hypothetical protein
MQRSGGKGEKGDVKAENKADHKPENKAAAPAQASGNPAPAGAR